MRIVSVSHAAFAAVLLAVGVMGLIRGDFAPIWEPIPKSLPLREALAWLSTGLSLACGTLLLLRRTAALAARSLLFVLLIWFLLFRAPVFFRAPTAVDSWEGAAETAVIIAGSWVLYACFAADWDRQRLVFISGERGVRVARMIYAFSMIVFGSAHFGYLKETASLVPGWLPWPVGWAGLTGGAYIAAGLAMLAGVLAPLASALSALQMGLFTVLVWLPIIAAPGPKSAFQWSETVISAALTIAGWLVAESYRTRR